MTLMSLPATAAWYGGYGMWWTAAFTLLGLAGVTLAAKHTREHGWKTGRHWVHLIVGSAGMVFMTLAMTTTSSGPVLALGTSMANMPGMEHMQGMESKAGMEPMPGIEPMPGMESMPGMDMGDMTTATHAGTAGGSSSLWRALIAVLAVYFLLSVVASLSARLKGTNRVNASRRGLGRWLLAMPDTVVVFLASLTLAVWDRARTGEPSCRGRRRKVGTAPDAALAAHMGMGGTMAAMLLMMAA